MIELWTSMPQALGSIPGHRGNKLKHLFEPVWSCWVCANGFLLHTSFLFHLRGKQGVLGTFPRASVGTSQALRWVVCGGYKQVFSGKARVMVWYPVVPWGGEQREAEMELDPKVVKVMGPRLTTQRGVDGEVWTAVCPSAATWRSWT